jgi:hypothetical protein
MASEAASQGGRIPSSVLRLLKIFMLNSWRRLGMLGHYTMICLNHLRLRRTWRVLGKRVHQALEGGEVNPMLAGEVKDSLAKAQALQMKKNRHFQTVAVRREKIRASWRGEAPPPPETEAPAPEEAVPGTSPEPKTGQEEGQD